MQVSELTAVILAGGLGTRLKSTVPDRPKALAPIHGRPFLAYLLRQIEEAGLAKAVLCIGVGAEQIEQTFGQNFGKLALSYSREESPLGTAGALRLALPQIRSPWMLVFNGDSFAQLDLEALVHWHQQKKARASLVLARLAETSRFGRVEKNERDEIICFTEKTESGGPGWINAGIYLLSQEIVAAIPAGGAVSLEREIFPGLTGKGLFGFSGSEQFLDIGTPESYAAAEKFFSR